MRIFAGIKASPDLQAEVAAWQEEHTLPVRYISPENLHITLVPPWEERDIDDAIEVLEAAAAGGKCFELLFTQISLGPKADRPNLIWIEAHQSAEANALANAMREAFGYLPAQAGGKGQKFRPHVTIARLNHSSILQNARMNFLPKSIAWSEEVDNVCLLASHGNSEYTVLSRIELE